MTEGGVARVPGSTFEERNMPSLAECPSQPSAISSSRVAIRAAQERDLETIQEIYAHHVLHGLASFETVPPSLDELAARRAAVLDLGLPFLVAEIDAAVVGYCYATCYRPRPAYRYTVEDSVYVAPGMAGRGIGSRLLAALIDHCERGPWRQMVAVIGNSDNRGSIALHGRLGFEPVGTFPAIGFKLGGWLDTVLMQRALGQGAHTPPDDGSYPSASA